MGGSIDEKISFCKNKSEVWNEMYLESFMS